MLKDALFGVEPAVWCPAQDDCPDVTNVLNRALGEQAGLGCPEDLADAVLYLDCQGGFVQDQDIVLFPLAVAVGLPGVGSFAHSEFLVSVALRLSQGGPLSGATELPVPGSVIALVSALHALQLSTGCLPIDVTHASHVPAVGHTSWSCFYLAQ